MVWKWLQVWCHKQVHNDIKLNLVYQSIDQSSKKPFILYMGITGPLWSYGFIK